MGHQRGQLGFDLRLGERVGHALVGPDRRVPHASGGGVLGGAPQGVAGDADAQRRSGDPLGVQAVEHLAEARALLPHQRLGGHAHVVEVQHELLVGQQDVDGQRGADEARRVGGDHEQREQRRPVRPATAARHHHQRRGLVDPRDVVLRAAQHPAVAVARGRGGEAVGVGARVRLGDREDDLHLSVGQAREPLLAQLRRAELADHLGRDRRRDEQEQQRSASVRDLLADDRELDEPAAAPAVLLRDVDPDVARVAQRAPQLVTRGACAGVVDVVVAAETPCDGPDGRAEIAMLVALEEVHGDSSDSRFTCGDRTARLP